MTGSLRMQIDQELHELKAALTALDAGIDRLRAAGATVTEMLDEAEGRVAMPNSRRAEQQLRTALNAATGGSKVARTSTGPERGHSPAGPSSF